MLFRRVPMTRSEVLLTQSKYYPRALKGTFPTRPEFFSVDPSKFDIRVGTRMDFSVVISEGIKTVAEQTEEYGREYSIMFYGEDTPHGYYFDNFYAQRAMSAGAFYTPKQKAWTDKCLARKKGEVIYGHTHVAKGSVYNNFSLTDLHYYIKRALETKRDVYAMLITKDSYTIIMYSYKEHEFFRVLD